MTTLSGNVLFNRRCGGLDGLLARVLASAVAVALVLLASAAPAQQNHDIQVKVEAPELDTGEVRSAIEGALLGNSIRTSPAVLQGARLCLGYEDVPAYVIKNSDRLEQLGVIPVKVPYDERLLAQEKGLCTVVTVTARLEPPKEQLAKPRILLDEDDPLVEDGAEITLQGTVEHDRPLFALWVDGQRETLSPNGTFSVTVPMPKPGDSRDIKIVVQDKGQLQGTRTVRLVRPDQSPPDIALDKLHIEREKAVARVTGTVRDPGRVRSIAVDGRRAEFDRNTGRFGATVNMPKVFQTRSVTVAAEDRYGKQYSVGHVQLVRLPPCGPNDEISSGKLRELQRHLKDLNFTRVAVDGILGPETCRAVEAFAGAKGWSNWTWEQLRDELAAYAVQPPAFVDEPAPISRDGPRAEVTGGVRSGTPLEGFLVDGKHIRSWADGKAVRNSTGSHRFSVDVEMPAPGQEREAALEVWDSYGRRDIARVLLTRTASPIAGVNPLTTDDDSWSTYERVFLWMGGAVLLASGLVMWRRRPRPDRDGERPPGATVRITGDKGGPCEAHVEDASRLSFALRVRPGATEVELTPM